MSDLDGKPQPAYIRELAEHIASYWQPQQAPDQRASDLYWDTHQVIIPDTANKDRSNRIEPKRMTTREGRRQADMALSFYARPATISVHYMGEGSRQADSDEFGLNEMIDRCNPSNDSPRTRRVGQQIVLGRGIQFIVPGHTYYWDFPVRGNEEAEGEWQKRLDQWLRKAPLPFVWMDLPAESTFPASFGTMDDEVLSIVPKSWYELQQMFSEEELGDALPEKPSERQETVALAIYSNRRYVDYTLLRESQGVGIGNFRVGAEQYEQPLRCIEHNLDRSAIRICPGLVSHQKEPGKYWLSILEAIAPMIEGADARLSEAATASNFKIFPTLKGWLHTDTADGARTSRTAKKQGDVIFLDPGDGQAGRGREDFEPLVQVDGMDDHLALVQFALDRAERMTGLSMALEGGTEMLKGPAWSANFSAELSKGKLSLLTQNIALADVDAAESIIRCVRSFDQPFPLTIGQDKEDRIMVNPSDLDDWEAVLVADYKPRMPMNQRADEALYIQMMIQANAQGLPFPSPEWVAEKLGIEQPMEEFKRTLKWSLLNGPESRAALMKRIMEEAEIELSAQEEMTPQEVMEFVQKLSPEEQAAFEPLLEVLLQRLQGGGGASVNGNGAAPAGIQSPDLQGAVRAGAAFSTAPGGPNPTEAI